METPDKNGKVEFKNLKLVTAGVYRFKITEALAEGANASDYKMDTNTWLAEIELLENGKVTAPKYIKVSSSDIKDKTDAELANTSTILLLLKKMKPCLQMKPHTEEQQ